MKKINFSGVTCCLILVILLTGCYGIPIDWDGTGMTKAEVAAKLEKSAFRSRWSGKKFDIEIPVADVSTCYSFSNAQEILNHQAVMSADQWTCDFYPQRH